MRRSLCLVAFAAGLLALSASGGDVRGTDPAGDVKTPGLTPAERNALDITSVRVFGEEGLGAFVFVTLRGNLEQAIGRGHLKNAVAGFVLRPKAGAGTPAGFLTSGATLIRQTVRLSSSKQIPVTVTQRDDYRKTRSKDVGVIRNGRELFFFVLGPGFSNVASIEVKLFASLPRREARQPADDTPSGWWTPFEKGKPSDDASVGDDPENMSTEQLTELKAKIQAKEKELVKETAGTETAIEQLDRQIESLGSGNPVVPHLKVLRQALNGLHDVQLSIDRILNGAVNEIDGLIRDRTTPPAPPTEPKLGAEGGCSFFDPMEVQCNVRLVELKGLRELSASSSVDAIKVVVPPAGSTPRVISAFLCPAQLPSGSNPAPFDTLTCSGGTLPIGTAATFNVRSYPYPTAGMGVQVFARRDGVFQGPFSLSGP